MLAFPFCCPVVAVPVVLFEETEVALLSVAEEGCIAAFPSPDAVFEACVVFLCLCGDEFAEFFELCEVIFPC